MHKTKNLYSLLSLFLLILLAFFFLFPLYWIITGSFKTAQSINGTSPDWFPKEWVLLNYQKLFSRQPTALFTLSIPFSGAFSGTGKDIVLMTGPKVPNREGHCADDRPEGTGSGTLAFKHRVHVLIRHDFNLCNRLHGRLRLGKKAF